MTHHHVTNSLARPPTSFSHIPRLRLKPEGSAVGVVDGAWWPRTDDLAFELPDLLAVLSVRLGPIDRITYGFGDWSKAPCTLAVGGRSVHLDGCRYQHPGSIAIHGLYGDKIVLLVVSPRTAPDNAYDTLMAAAGRTNLSTVAQLLPSRQRRATADRRASSSSKIGFRNDCACNAE